MRPPTAFTALASVIAVAGAMLLALAPAASAQQQQGPTPKEFVKSGGVVEICNHGTLFHGMVNLGCGEPHSVTSATTWDGLRKEAGTAELMLCEPSLVNKAVDSTEVAALGAGAALQCRQVPPTWGP